MGLIRKLSSFFNRKDKSKIGYVLIKESKSERTYKHTRTTEEVTLEKIHTNEMGTFWTFKNPLQMPFQRKHVFDQIQQHEVMGMGKEEILQNLDKIISHVNENRMNDVYHIASMVKSKLKDHWDASYSALLTASVMILNEDEQIDGYSKDEGVKKVEMWAQDKQMLAFFFSIANAKLDFLTKSLQGSSPNASEVAK